MGDRHNIEKIRQEIARKYNNKIRELESEVRSLIIEKSDLNLEINKLKSEINHQNEVIDRMLKYVDISKDELDRMIADEKAAQELNKSLYNSMSSLLQLYKPFRI